MPISEHLLNLSNERESGREQQPKGRGLQLT
jgi:hypothetical protein